MRLGQQRRAGIDFPLGGLGVTLRLIVAQNQAGMDFQVGIGPLQQQPQGLVRIPLAGLGIGAHLEDAPLDVFQGGVGTGRRDHVGLRARQ
jgi:hypothetical protein